jgi:hypothetical protein
MNMKRFLLLVTIFLSGCTEESFRQGGHDILSGACAQSPNCTVTCSEGQSADSYGRCGLTH